MPTPSIPQALRPPLPMLLLSAAVGAPAASAVAAALGPADRAVAADPPGAFARDRNFDMERLDLHLALDLVGHGVSGTATWTVRRLASGDLRLDAVALSIDEVLVDGLPVVAVPGRSEVTIPLPDGPVDKVSTVVVRYHAHPQLGLHWRGPPVDGGGPESPDTYAEVYSQGEAEDNRYWFPSYDHFDERFSYTGSFDLTPARPGWSVVTNSGPDLTSYLVMVAAGPYQHVAGPAVDAARAGAAVDLRAAVPPGTPTSWVAPVLDPLPDMLEWFARRTGVPYAWGSYTQTFVQRFIYSGMENTGSTVEHERLLSPPSVQATRAWVPSVVAHELAHQWYGDLLTARTPREMWLNEGFATFFGADWEVHDRRMREVRSGLDSGGADALAAAQVDGWRRASLDKGSLAGRWALGGGGATHAGVALGEASHNVYSKGAMVLAMLRQYLGEPTFWAGIVDYTRAHAHTSVDTIDLQRAMEGRSGRDLGWFFQQWTELPGVPRVTTSWSFSAADGPPGSSSQGAHVVVELHQGAGSAGEGASPVALPVDIAVDGGPAVRAWLTGESLTVTIPAAKAPEFVAIDPNGGLLVDWDQQQSQDAWVAQLGAPGQARAPYAQRMAVRALADLPERENDPLEAMVQDGRVPEPLREAIAEAIGTRRSCDPLLPLLRDPDERMRGAGANALGHCYDAALVPPMLGAMARETNSDVRAALLRSAAAIDPAGVMPTARRTLGRADALDPERAAAATAFAVGGTVRDVASLLRTPESRDVRLAGLRSAVRILQREPLGPSRERLRATLARSAEGLLSDLDLRGIQGGISVLRDVGDARSANLLEALSRSSTLPDLARSAREAAAAIAARVDTVAPVTPNEVGARLDAIEDRIKAVEDAEALDRR